MTQFGLSNVEMGTIFSSFVLGYALLQVPGGWLCDAFGARRVLAVSIFLWSAFTAATAVAGNALITSIAGVIGGFAIVRALVGMAEAAAMPSTNRLIADWLQPNERGFAVGLSISGITAGGAIAPPLIVWIVITWGWRAAFYLPGLLGIAFVVVWGVVADRGQRSPSDFASDASVGERAPHGRVPWKGLLGRRDLWCLTAAYFAFGYVLYIYFTWFYLYLIRVRGVEPGTAGLYTIAPFAVSTIAAPMGGWLTDRLSRHFGRRRGRCGPGMASLVLSAALITLGASAKTAAIAITLLSLAAGMLYLGVATYWAASIDLCKAYAGTASGFMNMGANLGGALSPSLTPLIAREYGWPSALYFAAAVALLGAVFWFGVRPDLPLWREPQEPSPPSHGAPAPPRTVVTYSGYLHQK